MSARRLDAAVPETLRTLRRYVGLLAEAGLTEGEAADALGIRHALEAARMRRAETAWRMGIPGEASFRPECPNGRGD